MKTNLIGQIGIAICKIISLLLLPCQLFAYDFIVDDIAYNITSSVDMTVEVTWKSKYSWNSAQWYGCKYSGNIVIPQTVKYQNDEYKVTGIGAYAFGTETSTGYGDSYANGLKSIYLPNTIEYIDDKAFWHSWGISTVTIPSAIKRIGRDAFYDCKNLTIAFLMAQNPPTCDTGAFGSGSYGRCQIVVPQKAPYAGWGYSDRTVEIVSFNTNDLTYSGLPIEISWTSNLPSYDISLSGNTTSVDAGNYVTTIKLECHKNNSLICSTSFELPYLINKAILNFDIQSCTREYGDNNPVFAYYISGFIGADSQSSITSLPEISTKATNLSSVGEYSITGEGGFAKNYTFNINNGILTVVKAPLFAKINSASREYGCPNPNFTLSYDGLKNGETNPIWTESPIFSTSATIDSAVGDYPISATAVPRNYEISHISDGILTINPAPLKVVAQNKSRLYYDENPSLTFYYSGFRNGETESVVNTVPNLTTDATENSNVGEYEIAISPVSAPNYDIIYQTGVLTILPRTLTVQTGQYERAYGESNPTFELQYSGFVASEDIEVLKTLPTAYTNATESSNVGTYPIYISGGDAINYSFQYNQGRLIVIKADQEIIWNQDLSNLSTGQQVELLAYSTSSLPISYTIDSNNVCECNR